MPALGFLSLDRYVGAATRHSILSYYFTAPALQLVVYPLTESKKAPLFLSVPVLFVSLFLDCPLFSACPVYFLVVWFIRLARIVYIYPYMTVYLMNSLQQIPCACPIYETLPNPSGLRCYSTHPTYCLCSFWGACVCSHIVILIMVGCSDGLNVCGANPCLPQIIHHVHLESCKCMTCVARWMTTPATAALKTNLYGYNKLLYGFNGAFAIG